MKIQLIAIVDGDEEKWQSWFLHNIWYDFNRIDVVVNHQYTRDTCKVMDFLLVQQNNFLHFFPSTHEQIINKFVHPGNDYYIVVTSPENDLSNTLQYLLDNYDEKCPILFLEPTEGYNNMAVNTAEHFRVGGFGEQSLFDKIQIDCANHDGREELYGTA